jgi:ResB-like family
MLMKSILNKVLSLSVAMWLCIILALGSIVLACLGATRAGDWMAKLPNLVGVGLLAFALAVTGTRALFRRRFDSALFHVGIAVILAGWLAGQIALRTASPENPANGLMALIDGDMSDQLYEGSRLDKLVGRVPFTIKLEKFSVLRYPAKEPGYEPMVREYCSRVVIQERDKPARVEDIRVNQPAIVQGFYIYQMSWGQTYDRWGKPVNYTVLQFKRDPGLYTVYAGFGILFVGAFWFAGRCFRLKRGGAIWN